MRPCRVARRNRPSMTHADPFRCDRCGAELESDDAVSIIEGICTPCRVAELPSSPGGPDAVSSRRVATDPQQDSNNFPGMAFEETCDQLDPLPGKITSARLPPDLLSMGDRQSVSGRPSPSLSSQHYRRRARDLAIGTVAGFLLTGAVTAFLLLRDPPFTGEPAVGVARSTSLRIKVLPSWAQVWLDGQLVGSPDAGGRITIEIPGDESAHWLEVTADGYHPDRRPLSVLSGADDVLVELVRKPYEVAIETDPPEAELYVNDQLRGFSPMTLSLLPTEPASLTVKRRGYEPLTRELVPPPQGDRLALRLVLAAAGPVLRVETDPPGARVTADGMVQGTTPLTVQLAPSFGGRDVRIAASAPGYDEAAAVVAVPPAGSGEAVFVQLALKKTMVEMELLTDPPGGRVLLDGRDLGPTPLTARFDPAETGRSIVVQAVLAGSHYGRMELLVPPAGESRRVTIPMEFNAQRVVFVAAAASHRSADRVLLAEQMVETISQLSPSSRFAILAATEDGVEAWPGGLGTEAATPEQKIRGYDYVRGLSPAASDFAGVLRALSGFQPTTVWLFAGAELGREDLRQLDAWAKGENLSVHIVRAASSPDDGWMTEWTAAHRGTLTILDAPAAVTMQPETEP